MMEVLKAFQLLVLFCPFLVLIIGYYLLKKLKMKQQYAVGFSADVTTLLLFIAIPYIVQAVWQYSIYILIIIVAIIIAIIFTFIDWRTKKEIEVLKLMRKIWRIYFAVLMGVYIVVIIAAIITFGLKNI
ncbi:MAG: DUF3397 family protein [Lysinibacillus sp.]